MGSATVTGRVVSDTTAIGVAGVQVRFFNVGGGLVGTVTTDSCGYFVAVMPSTATRFHLNQASINATFFYRQYDYFGKSYAATISTCTAPLPALADGTVSPLPGNIRLKATSQPPPAPPTGCT